MDELREWIRAAEAARVTCRNAPEFDALIRHQKQRLEELERISFGSPMARNPDEKADIKLIQELIFQPCNVVSQPFSNDDRKKWKRPDFQLIKDSKLCGYCELKSPRDDWFFDKIKPGEFVTRPSPTSNNLARQIISAVEQFDAINPDHELPNVLALVNHAVGRTRSDLIVTLTGIPVCPADRIFSL